MLASSPGLFTAIAHALCRDEVCLDHVIFLVKCRSPYSDPFSSGMPMSFDYLIFCQSSRMSGTLAAARNLQAFCCIRVLSVLCISIQLVCTWCYGGRSD